jgi:hypothetical protein
VQKFYGIRPLVLANCEGEYIYIHIWSSARAGQLDRTYSLTLKAQPTLKMAKCSTTYSSIPAAHYSYTDSGDPCGGNETLDITDVLYLIYSML